MEIILFDAHGLFCSDTDQGELLLLVLREVLGSNPDSGLSRVVVLYKY